jgi:N-acetylated-alpha-linked acidic dipeptidase
MAATMLAGWAGGALAQSESMLGFSQAGAEAQRALEAKFDANLSAEAINARLKLMSAAPNHVGSPHNKANAEYTLWRR